MEDLKEDLIGFKPRRLSDYGGLKNNPNMDIREKEKRDSTVERSSKVSGWIR